MKYESLKYQKITLTKTFFVLVIIAIATNIFFGIYQEKLSLEIGIASTLGTFLYGFFTASFMSFIQTKYSQFKQNFVELLGNVKVYYSTVLLFKQKDIIKKNKAALIKFLEGIKNLDAEDYDAPENLLHPVIKANEKIKVNGTLDGMNYFNIIAKLGNIEINREHLDIYGDRYLTGELGMVFKAFTGLFILIIASLTSYGVYSRMIGIFLVIIVIFSAMFLFHLDKLSYSEKEMRKGEIQETIDYIKSTSSL